MVKKRAKPPLVYLMPTWIVNKALNALLNQIQHSGFKKKNKSFCFNTTTLWIIHSSWQPLCATFKMKVKQIDHCMMTILAQIIKKIKLSTTHLLLRQLEWKISCKFSVVQRNCLISRKTTHLYEAWNKPKSS